MWFQTRSFLFDFSKKTCCVYQTQEFKGGAIFVHIAIILSNRVKYQLVLLHTKYQGSGPSGFREKIVYVFPYKPIKHIAQGWDHFRPKGHNVKEIERSPLDDTTYQISKF